MLKKITQLSKHLFYAIFSNLLYGILLYNVCTWLIGYSLLHAFLGNLVFIVLGLVMDEYALKTYQSQRFIEQLKKEKDIGKSFRYIRWYFDSFVSFKTVLYLFYSFILIGSQIITVYPSVVGEDLAAFFHVNEYSILLLIAFDMLIRQFAKDRERIKKIATELEKELKEKQD